MKKSEKDAKRTKRQYRQEVADYINKIRRNFEMNGVIDRTMTAQLDILAINLQLYLDAYDKVRRMAYLSPTTATMCKSTLLLML